MLRKKLDDAHKILKVLADFFPESDIAFDSLGEVYMRLKDNKLAIQGFEKVLELNPENQNAKQRLAELKDKSIL